MTKRPVKVYLSKKTKELLTIVCEQIGLSESEVLRWAFLRYADELNLIKEKVH